MEPETVDRLPLPSHLLPDCSVHVVISVLSGHCKAQEYYDETLRPFLDGHGIDYTAHTTTSAKTIINLTQSLFAVNATQGVKQTIILLSGDGGVVDIVDTLTTTLNQTDEDTRIPSTYVKPIIALLPMGTANALAWSSKVAQDPLGVVMRGHPQPLPSFQVRFSAGAKLVTDEGRGREDLRTVDNGESVMYGAVVFSWGLHASLVAVSDTAEYRKHGLERFKMAAEQLLKESHRYKGMVKRTKADGQWTELHGTEHSYILATLVSNLEEHFQISPATHPVDGTLRLVAMGPEPASDIVRILGLAYKSGQHVSDPKITYEEIEGLRIEFDEEDEEWRKVCVDGKIVSIAKGGWVEAMRIPSTGVDGRRAIELVC